jgi:putative ABC transport system permease protein
VARPPTNPVVETGSGKGSLYEVSESQELFHALLEEGVDEDLHGGYGWTFNFLILPDGSESLEGMRVTREYFRVTGLRPVLGRTFEESEAKANPATTVILGHGVWQRKFNGDPNIVGKTIRLSRRDAPLTIIGVMAQGARFFPSPGASKEPNYNVNATVDFWLPTVPNPQGLKSPGWDVVGRLRGGTTMRQAQAELAIVTERQAQAERDFQGFTPHVQSLTAEMNRDGSRILLPLLGAAALVLLIACGNAAALLLVRGIQRQQEYAVRSALGVSRIALFRQVSTESLCLALAGGVLGVALAFGAVRLFQTIGGQAIPRLDNVSAGWPVLACGIGSAVLAALLAGLIPALRASRLDPVRVLNSAGPKSSAGRGERGLLRTVTMVQTALTLALLVGAGLLTRTMMNLSKVGLARTLAFTGKTWNITSRA